MYLKKEALKLHPCPCLSNQQIDKLICIVTFLVVDGVLNGLLGEKKKHDIIPGRTKNQQVNLRKLPQGTVISLCCEVWYVGQSLREFNMMGIKMVEYADEIAILVKGFFKKSLETCFSKYK